MSMSSWMMMRSLSRDSSVADKKLAPGTYRRVLAYSRRHRAPIIAFVLLVITDSALVVAVPLLLRQIVDQGVLPGDSAVVIRLALIVAGIALAEAMLTVVQRWFSSRIGEGLSILDLRTEVFGHVLDPPNRRAGGQVLHEVSMSVDAGRFVALVGPSGAGKTTLTALVARLYDPTAGASGAGIIRAAVVESARRKER